MNILNAKESVVLGDTLATCGSTSLDFTDTEGDSEVGDDRIFSLTTAMRNHDTPTIRLSELSTERKPRQPSELMFVCQRTLELILKWFRFG